MKRRPMDDGEATRGSDSRSSSRAVVRIGWLTGALLLVLVVLVAVHFSEERALARLLRAARPGWLIAGAVLQLATYVCAGAVWQRALARRGIALRLGRLVPLGLAKLFTDQAVPTVGLSGTWLVVRGLEHRGVARPPAVSAMLTGLVAYDLAYLTAIALSIAVLGRHHELRPVILVPAALIALLAAGVPLMVLALHRRLRRSPPRWLDRLPGARDLTRALRSGSPRELFAPRLLAETALLQLAVFALDAATLSTMLLAVGQTLPFPLVFASFVMTAVGTSLAWVPGGLGAFEASCVALLHLHGVPVEAALAATLLLRGLTFWAPMLPGFALARHEAAVVVEAPRLGEAPREETG